MRFFLVNDCKSLLRTIEELRFLIYDDDRDERINPDGTENFDG